MRRICPNGSDWSSPTIAAPGAADGRRDGYSIDKLVDDMEDIAAALALPPFVAAGHSTGGVIVQLLALRQRCPLHGVVLSATLARPDDHYHLLFRTRLAVLESAGLETSARLAGLLGYAPGWLAGHAAEIEEAAERAGSENPAIAAARIRMLLAHGGQPDFANIGVPALVLGSEEDVIHPLHHQQELAAGIPGATLRLFPGGHFFPKVHPEAVAVAIADFADALPASDVRPPSFSPDDSQEA